MCEKCYTFRYLIYSIRQKCFEAVSRSRPTIEQKLNTIIGNFWLLDTRKAILCIQISSINFHFLFFSSHPAYPLIFIHSHKLRWIFHQKKKSNWNFDRFVLIWNLPSVSFGFKYEKISSGAENDFFSFIHKVIKWKKTEMNFAQNQIVENYLRWRWFFTLSWPRKKSPQALFTIHFNKCSWFQRWNGLAWHRYWNSFARYGLSNQMRYFLFVSFQLMLAIVAFKPYTQHCLFYTFDSVTHGECIIRQIYKIHI